MKRSRSGLGWVEYNYDYEACAACRYGFTDDGEDECEGPEPEDIGVTDNDEIICKRFAMDFSRDD